MRVQASSPSGACRSVTDGQHPGHWAWKNRQSKPDGAAEYVELKGDVRFNDVTFGYEPDKIVLHDISLYAKPGQKIAFVGSTGAGQDDDHQPDQPLLRRGQAGQITYDGIDIRRIRKHDLRHSLGMVLQDTHLFTGTILDNIRYGRRWMPADEECIEAAAKLANAQSFIKRLPQGYHTTDHRPTAPISRRVSANSWLSPALAVADPPVMILDEATSSIDTRTERLIEKGMDALMNGRTVFVIAHRLSTVRNSNAIMVLENGEIIERGDHTSLLAQQGRYYQLYTGQYQLT